ncbi:cell division protein FtsK [bacterium (Candidatus Gribaldobacteria) CG10_big_fil_rev_8_21_14_0_10_37_21]|uniref:Cell division protein FtsK n=1 Tax=bacterium (Candidatus Gribaldobacteria) CG10_big_fil_rev_8_21_14_0_10_37_21 TaxID=2014275 RepID=A0A2H0UUR5_9BACT|nr:MAG: cell division protein FtsK [bacterium (Candidatus Gribaldobacteria) CG10_big_fil_rev_8_21_14_0_10_37_21]
MSKRKRKKNNSYQGKIRGSKNGFTKPKKSGRELAPVLTSRLKRWLSALVMIALALIVIFSFFQKAGTGGEYLFKFFNYILGKTIFAFPFLLFLASFFALKPTKRRVFLPVGLGLFLCLAGTSGILAVKTGEAQMGGSLGKIMSIPLLKYFSPSVAYIVLGVFLLAGLLIFYELLPKKERTEKEKEEDLGKIEVMLEDEKKPKFEIKPVEIIARKAAGIFAKENKEDKKQQKEAKKEDEEKVEVQRDAEYKIPPLSLLDLKEVQASAGDTQANSLVIQRTLQNFGIEVAMAEINVGPTVTQYSFRPAEGVKLSKITGLNNDLALSLAAHPIRIEAPIPGKPLVGIEVPNKQRAIVKIGALFIENEFQKSPPLTFAVGRDVMGHPILADLSRMPHLLVAGATGSGKTICLNSIILSLIFRNSPKVLRLILIDPKKVEFPVYSSLPHLLTPVILNSRKAVNALNWLVGEMDRRFDVLRELGSRDIASYNVSLVKKPKEGFEELPYIVLIIDELADLMMAKGKEVEAAVVRLSQLARAVGIHLIVATQRPSVEVITGLIKANITSRIAFQVASQIDSRTILDGAGAEKLLGRGDMLFLSSDFSKPKRIQGGFISSGEINRVVDFIAKENQFQEQEVKISENEPEEQDVPLVSIRSGGDISANPPSEDIMNYEVKDELYDEAKETITQYQKASASLLQRRLQVGYARAARLLDMLEADGIVGPADGAKAREVYVKRNQPDLPGMPNEQDEDGFIDAGEVELN